MGDNEIEILEGLKRSDKTVFDGIVLKYNDKLINLSYKITYDKEISMEIVQDCLFEFFVSIKKFNAKSKIYTYLYRIVLNKSIDFVRRQKVKERVYKKLIIEETNNNFQEIDIVVNEALKQLHDKYRLPLLLVEYDKMKYEDVSEILKIPLNTVRTRVFYAREKLLSIFKKMGVDI